MSDIAVRRYAAELEADWHAVLEGSRNGLFLFDRRYMDYHSDRFPDFSAIAYVYGRPEVLLPATTRNGAEVVSHSGLTFGGFVARRRLRGEIALACVNAMLDELKSWGARDLTVKPVPWPLCSYPSQDVEDALWRRGFALVRRDLSSVLPLREPLPFNKSKRHAAAKATKAGLVAGPGTLASFHALLEKVLGERHSVAPVHSLAELELLASRFPNEIFLRSVESDGETLAGALIYRYRTAWHTQYMAASEDGREIGALDLVIARVIQEAKKAGADWLSFGTSTTESGLALNEGLLWQKESYGARSITLDFLQGKL